MQYVVWKNIYSEHYKPIKRCLKMKTHRDNVNPYENFNRAVGRDSSVDSKVPSVNNFLFILFLVLSQFIQAESTL